MNLVPGRDCGKCTLCCTVLAIDDPDFQKLPGVTCSNCKRGAGCQVYETRFTACRVFFCGWRLIGDLNNDWRPDRSGIMLRFQQDYIPPGYQPVGMRFVLVGGSESLFRPAVTQYMRQLMSRGVAVFLSVPGPVGYADATVFLNDHLAPAMMSPDRNLFTNALRAALDALHKNKFEPAVLKHANPAQAAN